MKVAVVPPAAVTFVGWVVMVGFEATVRVTMLLYTAPALFETLQRYWQPSNSVLALTVYSAVLPLVAVEFAHELAAVLRYCHW